MEEHTRLLEALCRIFGEKAKGKEGKEDVAKHADEIKQGLCFGLPLCFGGFTECAPQLYHWRASSLLKTTYGTEVAAKQTVQG